MFLKKLSPAKTPSYGSVALALLCNLFLVYIVYALCRIVYVWVNWDAFSDNFGLLSFSNLIKGSLLFDSSAIMYTNSIYSLLMLLPLHIKERDWWQKMCKIIFMIMNSLAIVVNLTDAVYFSWGGRRTTMTIINEFSHESNLLSVFGMGMVQYWYVVIIGIAMIYLLNKIYVKPAQLSFVLNTKNTIKYYSLQLLYMLCFLPCCIACMRGGFTTAVRPITVSNANKYVNRPLEAAIVLNTPFSLLRTIGKNVFKNPKYFADNEVENIYTPLHVNTDTVPNTVQKTKNVVVLIVESFGREYIGKYNEHLENGNYKGYAPFMDSLLEQSLSFDYTFSNGRKSIDGMPSILSSIPHFIEPFILTPASLNNISGIAGELGKCGYSSAFFHGAENGSMGFEAFARTTGFKRYYGRTEYNADNRFDGDADFDGTWAIWDEPFMQFFALKMTEDLPQPFVSAIFTASSHHPYVIPKKYEQEFNIQGEETNPIHKSIRYTDMALRKFFETAKKQPWYENTIFVFTSDHTNIPDHPEYTTDLGVFGSPILFFDPSGEMLRGRQKCMAQQIDIMPTILQYLGYSNSYIAFGNNLLEAIPQEKTWAVNYSNGVYQLVSGDHVIQFDGKNITGVYNYKDDWFMKNNLKENQELTTKIDSMEQQLKAIIQSYILRMTENRLVE